MNNTPLVSVIVNCFNGQAFLHEALNSVVNGKILKDGVFKNIWIQPAAGDAGGALGAALGLWHIENKNIRDIKSIILCQKRYRCIILNNIETKVDHFVLKTKILEI